ncbi:GTP pyrophosphokinase [Rhodococcoides kyotonense]|uniref:Putative GTP pyrophosphokinase n=1 Tax=Rhodococcoides kyotonense TaxID=398843 RepID=A0A239IEE4_9NOCA|nr:RelA/SpoT domain-containing protein [Rhodococcus kyotonensis]SNS92126.1 putative GTP pyrophosphokinase [Rhodococcus kyotonensis]
MTAPTTIDELVDELYLQRGRAWQAALVTAQNFLETIADELLDNVDRDRLNAQTARIKDPVRAADKLRRKIAEGRIAPPNDVDDVVEALGDLIGIKVLCKSPRDFHAFVDALDSACHDPSCSVRFAKDPMNYVEFPKPSGYRAYHAVLLVRVATHQGDLDVKVEVQVKTRLQDAWGELTHEDMYKPGEALKPSREHMDRARQMAELLLQVDLMADELAAQLDSQTADSKNSEAELVPKDPEIIAARVTRTGPRYALAVGPDGRRGLIPARSVKAVIGAKDRISVDDYLEVDDVVRVVVEDTEDALYYHLSSQPPSRRSRRRRRKADLASHSTDD